ncbi:MFS transporter [Candidatus Deianiraea vastatrix]|uniref:MFS transporter n=1 Tax=Candidatus Deianiraea vastatrix TaxID=2163644 RepID=A0A5B8XE75_9RICK|nr:MFS transporter [Candidatus Deianiraea vastatrix]QED23540.1 Putative MFS transporter [Candidatus Deianiraea vastatrix]
MINLRAVKYILLICASLSLMCTAIISPALPMMKKEFSSYHNAEILVKLAATVPNMLIAIFSPIFGFLIGRLTHKRIFLGVFLVIYVISGVATYFLKDLHYIIFTRALLGISISAIMTCGLELISHYFTGHERNKVLAAQTTVMSLGSIVFTMLSGYLCDINWRLAFLLYLTGIAIIPLITIYLRRPDDIQHNMQASQDTIKASSFGKIFGEKLPLLICIIGFANMVFFYMIPIQVPFLLKAIEPNISGKMISFVITMEVVISAFFVTKYKRLKKNRSFESMFAMSFCVMSLSYFAMSYSNSYTSVLLCVALYGLGMALMMPNNIIWIVNSVSGKNRAMWIGFLTSGMYLGKFISPLLIAPLISYVGMFKSYRVIAVIMLFIAILVSFITDGIKKPHHFRRYTKKKA